MNELTLFKIILKCLFIFVYSSVRALGTIFDDLGVCGVVHFGMQLYLFFFTTYKTYMYLQIL